MDKSSTPVIAVLNRKGGSGKSTLSTHIAGYLATQGNTVLLGDADRQQSSVSWLRRREANPSATAPIMTWVADARNSLRKPTGVSHIVLDTPAAMQGLELRRVLQYADAVLVPASDSVFDLEAASDCIAEVLTHPRAVSGALQLGVVGTRIDSRTRGAEALQAWADAKGVRLVTVLRLTQNYVRCAERGLTVFDLPADRTEIDRTQWAPLIQWLQPVIDGRNSQTASTSRSGLLNREVLRTDEFLVEPTGAGNPRPAPVAALRRPLDLRDKSAVGRAAPTLQSAQTYPRGATLALEGWSRVKSWLAPSRA